jgi:DNA recombination protein RmuC
LDVFAVFIIALVATAIGLGIGWLLAGRATGRVREELAAVRVNAGRADELARLLAEANEERELATARIAGLEAEHGARRESYEAQLQALAETKDGLSMHFEAATSKLLEAAQRQFLERADARFKQSEETAGQGLKALLQPVHERLAKYEETVSKVEAERQSAFGLLAGQISEMRAGTERVSGEAAKLVNALRNAPKARGRWGEQQLRNVLENCGLAEYTDFQTEVNVAGEDGGRLRPDAIIRVPGGKALVIDAKVSLNAYQDAFGAVDEAERVFHLDAHAASMRAHVNSLGNKAYWSQFDDAPDYVIMFVPGEHFLSAALEHTPDLWDFAFEKRVLLATPTNLIAIARTVDAVWKQERLAKEARRIGELGKEMYDRLAIVSENLAKAGSSLNRTVSQFNDATGSFNRNLAATGKKFRELNLDTGKRALDDIEPVETLASHAADLLRLQEDRAEDRAANAR